MIGINRLRDAVAGREALVHKLFDRLQDEGFDGIGITRDTYGPGEQRGHVQMREIATELGLEIAEDAAGNSYMTMPGRDRTRPGIIIGSHLDSVFRGGNFDGAAGVVAGLAALAALQDMGVQLPVDVTVMGIRAEESAWFGVSYIGSRAAMGALPEGALDDARRADTGRSLRQHMADLGLDPSRIESGPAYLDPARIAAYLEVHIEQGPLLEAREIPVAVVTGIRGNRRYPKARCIGTYAHCGGQPREFRQDAVLGVMDFVQAMDRAWDGFEQAGEDFACTIGMLATDPERHAMTIVPGEVGFSLDMRSLEAERLDMMEAHIQEIVAEIEARRGVTFELGRMTRAAPGPMDPTIRAEMLSGMEMLGLPVFEMASGASHDAAQFAASGVPTQMLFVRNDKGSHNPDEAMRVEDFMRAVDLLTWWLAGRA